MKRTWFYGLALALATCGFAGCDVDVEEPGKMPDVDVQADPGEAPDLNVRGPEVDVQEKKETVTVPDVDVQVDQEEKEVTVPDIDVNLPNEDDSGDDSI